MPEPQGSAAAPLVSVVVRSMNRPSLGDALASIAAQDYPAIEIVLVGASGPEHPPFPDRWQGRPMRFVASATPLDRPRAVNAGLDAATGDWITFLDDDDVFLAGHISGLMAARAEAPEARAVYCFARAVFADGRVQRFGQPFSLVQLYARNFLHPSMVVFARSLLAEGCRADESLALQEDWDLFLQLAQRTPFHFVPRDTFQWNADVGNSGGGGGTNQNDAVFTRFRDAVYAKWAPQRDALIERVEPMVKAAAQALRDGELTLAEERCREALATSPNDPWALNMLASIERATGRTIEARRTQQLAVAVCPQDPTLTFNLALLYRAHGQLELARRCCERALALDAGFAPAIRLREELAA